MHSEAVSINPEVRAALEEGKPVLALESTIIAHGMPYPTNVEVALAVEENVRACGAIPATLGILGGEIKVGLTRDEIEFMGTGKNILKAVERDIPMVVAKKLDAATTAGCSLVISAAAGIRVFVTGGIGGVGPVASQDFDISADLHAIEQYSVLTVCSGTKAFMDIPATLEYLETHRVPVVSYQIDTFPLFYSRSSGVKVDWVAQNPAEVASFLKAKFDLGMMGGMLLGVPVPAADEMPVEDARAAIATALERTRAAKITGKAVTPYLLAAIKEVTEGNSLVSNISLIKNNATVGAQIAVEYSKL
ncbi:MAG: pseudouridine-5'-phosphate glycosidase [Anaerolineae bacterium]|nr:pseudouridine-5'-phosphate glycosidase [Anaerolineae bacterium]